MKHVIYDITYGMILRHKLYTTKVYFYFWYILFKMKFLDIFNKSVFNFNNVRIAP